jgi:rod shape-determining protein MreB and related proteins
MRIPSLRLRGIPTDDLAADLGSTHVYIYSRSRGLVVSEPAVAAVDLAEGEVIATGSEALELVGRLSGRVEVRHPLRDGAVADIDLTEELLARFLRRAHGGRHRFSRRTVFAMPTGATDVERRAIRRVVERAAGGRVSLVDSLVAAALDVQGDVSDARALLGVDIGACSTQAAVVVDSEVVLHGEDRVGASAMDAAITEIARRRHDLVIGERTAERLKIELGSAVPPEVERESEARGQSLLLDRPAAGMLTNLEVYDAIQPVVRRIVAVVRGVVSELPPEIAADLGERGMVLVGGGSLLAGTVERLSKELSLPVARADSPRQAVVRGAARLFDVPLLLRRVSRRAEERG